MENNLIKTLEPKYNVVFRDDKSYPYLCISGDPFPQLRFFRGKPDKKHQYFRPVPERMGSARRHQYAAKGFPGSAPARTPVFAHRSRPCMLAQIGRCTAPCVGQINEADYAADVEECGHVPAWPAG